MVTELKSSLSKIGYNANVTSVNNDAQITVRGEQPNNLSVTYLSNFIGQKLGKLYKKSKASKGFYIFNKTS